MLTKCTSYEIGRYIAYAGHQEYEYYMQKKKDQEKQIEISTENFNNYLHKILKIDRATTPIIWNIPNLNDRRVFVSWKGL